jgi:hypothetical protein
MQFREGAGDVHVRQGDIAVNALQAAVSKRNFLAASAHVDPTSAAVLKMSRLYSIVLNVDPYHSAVFCLQPEFLPGVAATTTQVEKSLHWLARRIRNPSSLHQFSKTSNSSRKNEI